MAQVVLVGLPNVGKSQIVVNLTNATPLVAPYPFTTRKPTPGMMSYENIQIQLVDIPPLMVDFVEPWFPSLLKRADALVLVVELTDDPITQLESVIKELGKWRIRPIEKGREGSEEIFEKRCLIVGNKIDLPGFPENFNLLKEKTPFPTIPISAQKGIGLEELKKGIYEILDIIRIYTKAPGKKPDLSEPFVLQKGSTVLDVAENIHKEFRKRFKYARIWNSEKYGQKVPRDYILKEGDIIELHI